MKKRLSVLKCSQVFASHWRSLASIRQSRPPHSQAGIWAGGCLFPLGLSCHSRNSPASQLGGRFGSSLLSVNVKVQKKPVYPVYLSADRESDTRNGQENQPISALGIPGDAVKRQPKTRPQPVRTAAGKRRKGKGLRIINPCYRGDL